jgi:hypothetical protein
MFGTITGWYVCTGTVNEIYGFRYSTPGEKYYNVKLDNDSIVNTASVYLENIEPLFKIGDRVKLLDGHIYAGCIGTVERDRDWYYNITLNNGSTINAGVEYLEKIGTPSSIDVTVNAVLSDSTLEELAYLFDNQYPAICRVKKSGKYVIIKSHAVQRESDSLPYLMYYTDTGKEYKLEELTYLNKVDG